jgi:hypothetical protein
MWRLKRHYVTKCPENRDDNQAKLLYQQPSELFHVRKASSVIHETFHVHRLGYYLQDSQAAVSLLGGSVWRVERCENLEQISGM